MGFTNEQLQAIDEKGSNILVSAAAGSGKTTVLAERIISKIINDNINVDEILVVTFTNLAAEEMKERITKKIRENLEKNPNNQFLKEQLTRINKAQISTIDAFCLKVVKSNFKYIDIDPNFRIGDANEIGILKDDALDSFLEPYYMENNKDFIEMLDFFTTGTSDDSFKSIFIKIYEQSQNMPYPVQWINNACKYYNINSINDFILSDIFLILIVYIKEILQENLTIFENIKHICTGILDFEKNSLTDKTMEKFLTLEFNNYTNLLDLINANKYSEFITSLNDIKFARFSAYNLKNEPEFKDIVKGLRDKCKDVIKDIAKKYFAKPMDDIIEENKIIYPKLNLFCTLLIDFDKYFMSIKKEHKIFTFNDISHFCLNIINIDEIKQKYMDFFNEIIIDEYQDSNSIQEEILSSISNNNRFMVGDIKQCIYKFRQANPLIFNKKYTDYEHNDNGIRIDLNANFRSNKCVIDGINFIFENLMCKKFGEIDYDDKARLYNGLNSSDDNDKKCELHIIKAEKDSITPENSELLDMEKSEFEAHFICKKIVKLIDDEIIIFDKELSEYRKIQYKDIAILMRTGVHFPSFIKVFEQYNIPSYYEASSSFYDTIEIKTMLNILKIIDNPLQDMAIVGSLYSPIFNFCANELLDIKLIKKHSFFYHSVLEYAKIGENESLKEKCNNFIQKLSLWKSLSFNLDIPELLNFIYKDSNYYNYVGFLQNAHDKQTNLTSFIEKAITLKNYNITSLFNFVSHIEKIKQFGDEKIASSNDKDNFINIMTIHKSKGLEFPVVFLANTHKQFNKTDNTLPIIFDEKYMLGISVISNTNNDKYPIRKKIKTLQKDIIVLKQKAENYSEEMRILYVALTRAREKLIVTGITSKSLESMQNLFLTDKKGNMLASHFISSGSSDNYLAWIYSVLCNKPNTIWDLEIHNHIDVINNTNSTTHKIDNNNLNSLCSIIDLYSNEKNTTNLYDFSYKNKIYQHLNTTLSTTSLKSIYNTKLLDNTDKFTFIDNKIELPRFYTKSKESLSPAEIGSIYHKIFEKIDFSIDNTTDLTIFFNTLIHNNILTENEISYIEPQKVLDFLNLPILKRLLSSIRFEREKSFILSVPPEKIYTDKEFIENKSNNILISGVIDLYFEETDKIVLIDYKTDKVKDLSELINNYKIQLDFYKFALEQAIGKPVCESYIYSIFLNELISI